MFRLDSPRRESVGNQVLQNVIVRPRWRPWTGGKFAIYKFEGDRTAAERIYQGVIPDGSSIGVQSLSLDVTGSLVVAVACDAAGSTIIPELVKQTRLTTPSVTSAGFPDSFQYIGTHTHNADFPTNQLPTVKG